MAGNIIAVGCLLEKYLTTGSILVWEKKNGILLVVSMGCAFNYEYSHVYIH